VEFAWGEVAAPKSVSIFLYSSLKSQTRKR
jgi:hypothetical protein